MFLQPPELSPTALALLVFNILLVFTGSGVLLSQLIARLRAPDARSVPFMPPEPVWALPVTLAVALFVFFFGSMLGSTPFFEYLKFLEKTNAEAASTVQSQMHDYAIVVGSVCGQLFAIAAIFLLLKYLARQFRFNAPAMRDKKNYAWHPAACIFGGFALSWIGGIASMAGKFLFEAVSGKTISMPKQDVFDMVLRERGDMLFISLTILAAVVLAPIAEELFFRGMLFRIFRVFWARAAAAAACGAIFGLIHFNLFGFVALSMLGAYLCYIYERTGDIRAPILAHVAFNLNSMLVVLFAPELADMF